MGIKEQIFSGVFKNENCNYSMNNTINVPEQCVKKS